MTMGIGPKMMGLALVAMSAFGQYRDRSYGGGGKCTVEVDVDGATDVLVTGGNVQFRNLAGRRPYLVRSNCTAPMPVFPAGFRFNGRDGRGRQTLIADPLRNRGTAVIRVEDRDHGRERYTFELYWNGVARGGAYSNGGYGNGGYQGYTDPGYSGNNGGYPPDYDRRR